MSTITKQWLQQAINDYESVRDEIPFGLDEYQGNILAALRIALASLEAEPVAYMTYKGYLLHASDPKLEEYSEPMPLYTAPQLPQPAVLSVSDGVLKSLLPDAEKPDFWFEHNGKIFFEGVKFNNAVFEAFRAAMLQSFGNSEQLNSPVIPDGWVMVPEDPTHEMLEAGDEQFGTYDVYRRMIEAAPKLE